MRVRKDLASQAERLLEPNRADQERKRLGQADGVERNVEGTAQGEGEQERKDGGHEDAGHKPEIGAECARLEEEPEEGAVHEDVAEQDNEDVERVGLLRELPEAHDECTKRIRNPLAALHFPDGLGALWALDLIAGAVDRERSHAFQRSDPVLPGTGSEAERNGRW